MASPTRIYSSSPVISNSKFKQDGYGESKIQHELGFGLVINNNNNDNLYLSVKAKIAVTEPLNGDTISEIYIYINISYVTVIDDRKCTTCIV